MSAATRWAEALDAWAIPQEILDAAPESPWGFPPELFTRKVDQLPDEPTPSSRVALDALQPGGTVLDVGCGAGAGALPLAAQAHKLIGLDPSPALLAAFQARAAARGVTAQIIEGTWPAAADRTPVADVVVCHNVAYNVRDLAPFLQRLTDHARRRVVLELHASHPLSNLNDLWLRFHGLQRPERPTADDAVAVLRELGFSPRRIEWTTPGQRWSGPTARQDLVAWVRRRVCLTADRDGEIAEALQARLSETDEGIALAPRLMVTLWWDGTAA
jgi:SAM-dependent methyltransferase